MRFQESETVELKEIYTEEIRKEVIAFANSSGGKIYIGIRDDGEAVGLSDPDAVMQKITNGCRDAIKPDVTLFLAYQTIMVEEKQVLLVNVQRGSARPYYLSAKGLKPSGVFVRQGTTSAPASDEAIRRMIKETDGDDFESIRSLHQQLTFEELKKVFSGCGLALKKVQMRTLGLINEEDVYTNLALLLSDQCPHLIKVAAFKDSSQEVFLDRKEFGGSLLRQLEDAYQYLDMRNQKRAVVSGLHRIDARDYPEAALREALVNAIVHRDYSNLAGTIISIYEDRIEFVSYGGLAGNVTLMDVLSGLSICRNRRLAEVFYRLKFIEAYGTGLQKIRNSYKDNKTEPVFTAGPNSFKVVLPNMNEEKTETGSGILYSEENQIVNYIRENGVSTRTEIQEAMELSSSTAVRRLNKLKLSGLIETVGSGKNIKYRVKE